MMWVNIIAVIVAPIAAVVIGQKLQDRAEKRKDKMAVFKAVMTYSPADKSDKAETRAQS